MILENLERSCSNFLDKKWGLPIEINWDHQGKSQRVTWA